MRVEAALCVTMSRGGPVALANRLHEIENPARPSSNRGCPSARRPRAGGARAQGARAIATPLHLATTQGPPGKASARWCAPPVSSSKRPHPFPTLLRRLIDQEQRKLHIFPNRERGKQVEKNWNTVPIARLRRSARASSERPVMVRAQLKDHHSPLSRSVDSPHHIEQGRLARPRRAP